MWKAFSYCRTGGDHERRDVPCQDAVLITEDNDVLFLGLADGAGSKKYAKESAEGILEFFSKYLPANFDTCYEDCIQDISAFSKKLADLIKNYITSLSKSLSAEYKQFGSTLLVLCIKEDRFLKIHIGDGVIIYGKGEDEYNYLSEPTNGEAINETPLTTSSYLSEFINIRYGNISEQTNMFLLASDGGSSIPCDYKNSKPEINTNILKNYSQYFKREDSDRLFTEFLDDTYLDATGDDFSMIYVEKTDDQELTAKTAIDLNDELSLMFYNTRFHELSNEDIINISKISEAVKVLKNVEDKEVLLKFISFLQQNTDIPQEYNIICKKCGVMDSFAEKMDVLEYEVDSKFEEISCYIQELKNNFDMFGSDIAEMKTYLFNSAIVEEDDESEILIDPSEESNLIQEETEEFYDDFIEETDDDIEEDADIEEDDLDFTQPNSTSDDSEGKTVTKTVLEETAEIKSEIFEEPAEEPVEIKSETFEEPAEETAEIKSETFEEPAEEPVEIKSETFEESTEETETMLSEQINDTKEDNDETFFMTDEDSEDSNDVSKDSEISDGKSNDFWFKV